MDSTLKKYPEKLGSPRRRSKSSLPEKTIHEHTAIVEWQIMEIRQALTEADRGDFATEREVQKVLNTWAKNAR
jgi:predicted transcriptional regulator